MIVVVVGKLFDFLLVSLINRGEIVRGCFSGKFVVLGSCSQPFFTHSQSRDILEIIGPQKYEQFDI